MEHDVHTCIPRRCAAIVADSVCDKICACPPCNVKIVFICWYLMTLTLLSDINMLTTSEVHVIAH